MDTVDAADLRLKTFLHKMDNEPVYTLVHYHPEGFHELIGVIRQRTAVFHFINTMFFRASASMAYDLLDNRNVKDLEIVDDSIAHHVLNLLMEISRLYHYHRTGLFRIGVLNVSIGAPSSLPPTRIGQSTMRRAYRAIVEGLDVPLVTTAGNDGPARGLFNSWATTPGVIVAAAATADGSFVGDFSGRPQQYTNSSKYHFFSAHGVDSIGARAAGSRKTPEMLNAESRINLAAIVGQDNVDKFRVDSGTSYAAAQTTRTLCFAHQMVHMLLAYADSQQFTSVKLPPFIRAYIDSGIDTEHESFSFRLADKGPRNSGMILELDAVRKQRYYSIMARERIDLNVKYSNRFAVRFLKAIVRRVPNASPEETGHGFVSMDAAAAFVRESRFSSLIELFGEDDDVRTPRWKGSLENNGDPKLFSKEETDAIYDYCKTKDLSLMRPLFGSHTRSGFTR